jgi:hypothetical protein
MLKLRSIGLDFVLFVPLGAIIAESPEACLAVSKNE